jgi:hypothetical protein
VVVTGQSAFKSMIVPRVSCMPVRAQRLDALRRSSAARLAAHVRCAAAEGQYHLHDGG